MIPHVHKKTAKGRAYWYFDTGAKKPDGKPILKRLPAPSDPAFGRALADAQRARNMRASPDGLLTVAGLANLYEKSEKFTRQLAANSRRNYRIYLDVIREEMGKAPPHDVTSADVAILMDKMADRPSAANMSARTLGALYAWARKRGHVPKHCRPLEGVEFLTEGEHEPWPEWLLEEALKANDDLVRRTVALLYYTAQRFGDVLAMRWTDIRGERICLRQQKTDTPLEIRVHSALAAELAKAPRLGFTIITKPDGTPYSQGAIRPMLQAFAAERGVKVVPHGLRKNAVNSLLEIGCTVAEVQAISGQSLQMIEHYAKRRNRAKLGDSAVLKWERKESGT